MNRVEPAIADDGTKVARKTYGLGEERTEAAAERIGPNEPQRKSLRKLPAFAGDHLWQRFSLFDVPALAIGLALAEVSAAAGVAMCRT